MKNRHLLLGESRFTLALGPSCSALLPLFFLDTAWREPASDDTADPHHLAIEEGSGTFLLSCSKPGEPASELELPNPQVAMLHLEYEIEKRVIADARDLTALHGGAVTNADGAWLVLGNSEDGKSSTTFQLAELGCHVLCEEVTLVEAASRCVIPFPRTLSLSTAMVAEYEASFGIRGRLFRELEHVIRYHPPAMDEEPTGIPRTLRGILLPKYSAGAPTRLTRVPTEEALPELLGYAFPPNIDAEVLFDRMIGLLHGTEIERLEYGDATAARSALAELLDRTS